MALIGPIRDGYEEVAYSTCPRCGREFRSYLWERAKANICHVCRVPKTEKRLRGNRKTLAGQGLTARNLQVAQLVAQGLINKEIADRLHLSTGTIKIYVGEVLAKLSLRTRVDLAVWAVRNGKIE